MADVLGIAPGAAIGEWWAFEPEAPVPLVEVFSAVSAFTVSHADQSLMTASYPVGSEITGGFSAGSTMTAVFAAESKLR